MPTAAALDAMAAIVAPEDGGESPFGWIGGSELTPEGPGEVLGARLSPELPLGGLPEPDAQTAQRGAQRRPEPQPCETCGYIPGWVSPRRGAPCGHGDRQPGGQRHGDTHTDPNAPSGDHK